MSTAVETDATSTHVPPGQGADKPAPKEETVTLSKAEVESLRRERDEANQTAKYWANFARQGGQPADQVVEDEEEIEVDPAEVLDPDAPDGLAGDTPDKLVDELASQGTAALRKRGYVTAKEAQQIAVRAATQVANKVSREVVGNERQKLISDNQLLGKFPELRDNKSELFKETAKIYSEAVAMDPSAKKTPAALYLAATAAKQLIDSRGVSEEEQERLDRVAAQDGRTRGRRESAEDDMLGPEAAEVLRQMKVTPEDFKAEKAKLTGGDTRTSRRTR